MQPEVIAALACPHCGDSLWAADATLRCGAGHTFDIARQGYVSLLPGDARTSTADTAEMVAARHDLLAGGHLDPLSDAVAVAARSAVDPAKPGLVVDVGAGTGAHLARVLAVLERHTGIALDLSKHAMRRAARAHPRMGAVVCDAWRHLPLRDGVADLVLNVFAPRGGAEFARVLRSGGALIVVTPTARHLAELVGALGMVSVDPDKQRRLFGTLGGHLQMAGRTTVEHTMDLGTDDVLRLVEMGPSARHRDPTELRRRAASLGSRVAVTSSVEVGVWHPR